MRKISAGLIVLFVFLLAFSAVTEAGVLKGPYLIYGGNPTQMTVLWQLDADQTCTIHWGLSTDYSAGSADVASYGDIQYQYTISGLLPGTLYYYQVEGVGEGSFRAAPDSSAASAKLLAYSDPQGDALGHATTCAVMIDRFTEDPSFQTLNICAGDRADEDREKVWADQYFTREYEQVPYFLSHMPVAGPRGNHEGEGIVFKKYWPYPYVSDFYWSFDYGPVHVAVVDQTIDYGPGSPQYTWLVNDLSTTNKQWKLLTFHQPGWSAGGVHENNPEVQQYIQPLCVQYGVDLVISGHNHYYARAVVEGVQHLTTGGAGEYIYTPVGGEYIVAMEGTFHFLEIDIQGREASVTARRRDGSVIETFNISHGPSVRITSPQDNSTLTAGQATKVQARVLPAGGTYSEVRFYADGQLIGTGLTEPYEVSWVPTLSSSPVTLTAEADISYAGSTETVTSVPVTVNVTDAPQPQNFNVRMSSGSDDAEEFLASGWMYLNSSDLELIHDSEDQIVGMRFNSIAIPARATILEAYVQFTVKDVSTGPCNLVIRGQAADNVATFSSTYHDISRRPVTAAASSWTPAGWATIGAFGPDQRTPNLSAIIHEIVNRPGWQLGNSMALIVSGSGTRTAVAYEMSPTQAAQLVVTYLVPPPNQAPVVNAGPDQTITFPSSASLSGTATDDGLPTATLTITWSKVSGPGTVSFGNANSLSTTASFSTAGTYTLRLTASDSALSSTDDMVVTVNSPANQAPVVNAGPDQTITLPASASLLGTASDDGLPNPPAKLTTTWSMASGPGTVTFANASALITTATFTATGTYTLRLTVSDGALSSYDEMVVTVNSPANQAPVVNAGADQTITLPGSASLLGTASDDGLPNPPAKLTTTWSMVSGPGTVSFGNASSLNTMASFTTAGTYTLRLAVSDGALSSSDEMVVTVQPPANQAPVVNAGADQTITLPGSASLLGTASDDGLPNPPAKLTTTWSMVSGPGTVSFGNASSLNTMASFTTAGIYTLRLTASDGALSSYDEMVVTVNSPANQAPVVNAGSDQTINFPNSATLSGTATDDGLPNPPATLSPTWSKVSGPGTVTFSNASSLSTTVRFSKAGTYTLRLTVSDGALSSSDNVIINVKKK